MPVATLLYLLAAGIALQAGLTHAIAGGAREPRDPVHLSFAAVALATSVFTVSSWAAHVATTPAQYVALFRGPWFISATFALVAVVWFVAFLTDLRPLPFLYGLSAAAAIVLLQNMRAPQGLILRGVTELREVRFPFSEPMALHVAVDGPSPLVPLINLAVVGFIGLAMYRQIRRRGLAHAAPLVVVVTLLLAASVYDGFVDAGMIATPYTVPLAMVGIVLFMSVRLAGELRRSEHALAQQADELRAAVERRTGELRIANAALTRRVDELNGLRQVAHVAAPPGRLRPALGEILAILGPLVEVDAAALRVEAWGTTAAITASWSAPTTDRAVTRRLDDVLRGSASGAPRDAAGWPVRETWVPLSHGGDVAGTIVLLDRGEHRPVVDRMVFAEMVASDVVTLVLQHRLLDTLRDAATAEERRRISRELHESVTQTLYSVSMLAEALPGTYEEDPDLGRRALAQLRDLTLGALAELRELLAELRPDNSEQASLRALLQDQADGFTTRFQIPVDVTLRGDAAPSGEVKVAIRRVVRELLSNVARHADATRVGLHVRASADGGGSVEVIDDGDGFDPDGVGPDHHGLEIARERLTGVGGELQLRTTPGGGTCAVLHWPSSGVRGDDAATVDGHTAMPASRPLQAGTNTLSSR